MARTAKGTKEVVAEFLNKARQHDAQLPDNEFHKWLSSPEPVMTLEEITPHKAKMMLEVNINNRPLSQRNVDNLVFAMESGHWQDALGDPIRFDRDGFLLDGQNRLTAVIRSGRSIKTFVLRGLPPESFANIDQGRARSASQLLSCAHIKSYSTVSAALRILFQLPRHFKAIRMETWEMLEMLKLYPETEEVATAICRIPGHTAVLPGSISTALKVLTDRSDKEKSERFWNAVLNGENISVGDPPFTLRKRLIESKASVGKAKLTQNEVVVYSIKAWNAFKEGRKITALRWDDRDIAPKVH